MAQMGQPNLYGWPKDAKNIFSWPVGPARMLLLARGPAKDCRTIGSAAADKILCQLANATKVPTMYLLTCLEFKTHSINYVEIIQVVNTHGIFICIL